MELPLFIEDFWFWLLLGVTVWQLLLHFILFAPLLGSLKANRSEALPPVSVIIVARNEASNLSKNLPSILSQDYPDFEVIVVNNKSEDDTARLLKDMALANDRIQTIHLGELIQDKKAMGKKLGITLGVKRAKHEHLVLTDADCFPPSERWLRELMGAYQSKSEVVLAIGSYELKSSLLNLLVQFETGFVALQYLSLAHWGMPYMGVGRNLSYKKSLFLKNNGFAKSLSVPYGDDDLFIQQVANGRNTRIVTNPSSQTISAPPLSFGVWIKQKKRHLGAGKLYKPGVRIVLALIWLSYLAFYGALFLVLAKGAYSWALFGLIALNALAVMLHAGLVYRRTGLFQHWWIQPLLSPIYNLIIYPLLGLWVQATGRPQNWN